MKSKTAMNLFKILFPMILLSTSSHAYEEKKPENTFGVEAVAGGQAYFGAQTGGVLLNMIAGWHGYLWGLDLDGDMVTGDQFKGGVHLIPKYVLAGDDMEFTFGLGPGLSYLDGKTFSLKASAGVFFTNSYEDCIYEFGLVVSDTVLFSGDNAIGGGLSIGFRF